MRLRAIMKRRMDGRRMRRRRRQLPSDWIWWRMEKVNGRSGAKLDLWNWPWVDHLAAGTDRTKHGPNSTWWFSIYNNVYPCKQTYTVMHTHTHTVLHSRIWQPVCATLCVCACVCAKDVLEVPCYTHDHGIARKYLGVGILGILLILGLFLSSFRFCNRNGFIWVGFEPGGSPYTPMQMMMYKLSLHYTT